MTVLSKLTKLLETIDSALEEVEQQLLQEFDRIRNTLSDSRFEPIDRGIKVALWDVVEELRHMLENSGDKVNLELQTRQHETVFARLIVLRQLLNSRIPTAFLHEAHQELETARKKVERELAVQRGETSVTEVADEAQNRIEKPGFFNFFKKLFSTRHPEKAGSNKSLVEQKRFELMEIYLDNGIYSPSRDLAIISIRMIEAEESGELDELLASEDKEAKMRLASGKAQFRSRELSGEALEAIEKKEREMARSYGKARFESRELSRKRLEELDKKQQNPATRGDIAQSPEEIRKKLATRDRTATGKASFSSKDIKHEMPAVPLRQDEIPTKQESPSSKAVFKSKDVSKPRNPKFKR
ncbi:MAG: hypothetical protein ABGY96_27465 [bacterium]|nr:hypothetical protein [Gammaproteobacteria bacterium]HIL98030.1 hypothetical protein [Pseudomonadales bacterium]